ncbi:hypothetical protein CCACVL1_19659 [Corchorus capsularis]|uniref:Uncharacterized protein n=1 Tax=Corchorus capsularis TaxID=210143 RepID=A0A1R3HFK5_COCAP|nr:hypothetical protein CCACVL1_19659 [Corchorus capsularis]
MANIEDITGVFPWKRGLDPRV